MHPSGPSCCLKTPVFEFVFDAKPDASRPGCATALNELGDILLKPVELDNNCCCCWAKLELKFEPIRLDPVCGVFVEFICKLNGFEIIPLNWLLLLLLLYLFEPSWLVEFVWLLFNKLKLLLMLLKPLETGLRPIDAEFVVLLLPKLINVEGRLDRLEDELFDVLLLVVVLVVELLALVNDEAAFNEVLFCPIEPIPGNVKFPKPKLLLLLFEFVPVVFVIELGLAVDDETDDPAELLLIEFELLLDPLEATPGVDEFVSDDRLLVCCWAAAAAAAAAAIAAAPCMFNMFGFCANCNKVAKFCKLWLLPMLFDEPLVRFDPS